MCVCVGFESRVGCLVHQLLPVTATEAINQFKITIPCSKQPGMSHLMQFVVCVKVVPGPMCFADLVLQRCVVRRMITAWVQKSGTPRAHPEFGSFPMAAPNLLRFVRVNDA